MAVTSLIVELKSEYPDVATVSSSTPAAVESAVAAEVLELGQALFDAVIETALARCPREGADEAYPEAELRAAADQFFTALRLLLGLEQAEDAGLVAPAAAEGHEGRA